MDLNQAIEQRRARRAELTEEMEQLDVEVEQLEKARELVEGILDLGSLKPPPRARAKKEQPVRAEKSAPADLSKNSSTHFRCGHLKTPENSVSSGVKKVGGGTYSTCRTCSTERSRQARAKKAGKSPKAKAEPDPVPAATTPPGRGGAAVANVPATRLSAATVEAPVAIAPKKEGLVLDAGERAAMLERANKWKGQCSAVNERGQRCGLLHPHDGAHNASGRPFTTAYSAGSALPRRELDLVAVQGGGVIELDAAAAVRLADVEIQPLPEGASGAEGLRLDALPGCCIICDEPLPAGRWRQCGSPDCAEIYNDVAQRVHKQLKRAPVLEAANGGGLRVPRDIELELLAERA